MFPGNGIPAPPLSRSFFLRHVFAPFRPMAPSLLILPGLGISPGWSCQAFICTKESSCDVLQKGTDCCRPDFLPCSRGIFLPHRCGISPSSCRPQNTGPFEWTTKHPSSDPKNKGILGQQKNSLSFSGLAKILHWNYCPELREKWTSAPPWPFRPGSHRRGSFKSSFS